MKTLSRSIKKEFYELIKWLIYHYGGLCCGGGGLIPGGGPIPGGCIIPGGGILIP